MPEFGVNLTRNNEEQARGDQSSISLGLGPGEDFLKSQIVSKRVPFQRVRKSESNVLKQEGRIRKFALLRSLVR